MKITKQSLIVNLMVENKVLRFLLDTGSDRSFIKPIREFKKYKYVLSPNIRVRGVGKNRIIKEAYHFSEIVLESTIISSVEFLELKRNWMFRYLNIDGVLGWDVLQRINFELDLRNRKLKIYQNSPLFKNTIKLSIIEASKLMIPFEYFNYYGLAVIDTGATNTYAGKRIYQNTKPIKYQRELVLGINGLRINKVSVIDSIIFKQDCQEMKIDNLLYKEQSRYDLQIGLDTLLNKTVYIDNEQGEVLILD